MILRKPGAVIFVCIYLIVSQLNAQTISGKIIDALSKSPVVNAKITILELKKEYATDSAGIFRTDTLAKGSYSLRVEAEKYLKQTQSVKIIHAKGETGTTEIALNVLLFAIASDVDQTKGKMAVKYFFPNHSDVTIEVCEASGKTVRTVYDRSHLGGMRTFNWDGADNKGKILPAGTYTCKFKSGNLFTARTLTWNGAEKQ